MTTPAPAIAFTQAIPILRIFDLVRAREFYADYLGFAVDWEHRFEPGTPLYMQVSRAGLRLHLSEHHGDGTPGTVVFVRMSGLRAFHAELAAKGYGYLRPGVEDDGDSLQLQVIDPFGNRIRFDEAIPKG